MKQSKIQVKKQSKIKIKEKEYSNFEVTLSNGSRRKQRLSNRLAIRVEGENSSNEIRLSLRDARALQNFLNSNLG